MFLLDTNIISELRKAGTRRIDRHVGAWERATDSQLTFLSVITILELETGVLLLARRDQGQARIMRSWINEKVLPNFAGRILPIDQAVALRCAPLHVPNLRPEADALIAATALVHDGSDREYEGF